MKFHRIFWKVVVAVFAVLFVLREAACDYTVLPPKGGNGITGGISVSISPLTDSMATSTAVQLKATVSGWKSDSTVIWSMSDTTGTLVATGNSATYISPAHLKASPTIVIVRAQSKEDTSRSGYCTITITSSGPIDTNIKVSIVLTPFSVTLQPGQSQQFQATVSNTANTNISWKLVSGPGTLSAQGLYVAPASVGSSATAIVQATAQADTSVWAQATITIMPPADTTPCFQSLILPIITSNCTMSGCHSAGSNGDAEDLTTYSRIMRYVRAGSASQSRLYTSITGTGEDRMPKSRPPLSPDQIALIARWINDGAKNTTCDQGTAGCDTTNIHYSSFVKGAIQNYCLGCHSGPSVPSSGGIDLSTYSGVQAVAANGQLVGTISNISPYPRMPQTGPALDSCTVAKIRAWVNRGAPND